MSKSNDSEAYDQASRWLTRRSHSERELREKLRLAEHPAALIEATIVRLHSFGYLDDAKLAADVAAKRTAQGYGPLRLRADLERRGIDAATIDATLREEPDDQQTIARRLLLARFPRGIDAPRDRARAARFLINRGFDEETLLAIIGEGC